MDEETNTANEDVDLLELTAHIVSAYVAKNRLPASGLGELIASVASSIGALNQPPTPPAPPPVPAVNP
ncbi:MAG: transcriptional regulator, partial [Mesorhizobium sp.]